MEAMSDDYTRRMLAGFEYWAMKDALWWQFWMPQSGVAGGLIAGIVIGLIVWLW